jgi:hypothetical protein
MLTEFINAANRKEADNFSKHCDDLHGERWKREWAERKAKAEAESA